jgi:plasmid stabilization system protein ParE
MNYTVLWTPLAEQELARLWTNAPDRNAVTAAADVIDDLLGRDPLSQGEARADDTRLLFVPPLTVLFQVSEADRTVHVLRVGLSRRP